MRQPHPQADRQPAHDTTSTVIIDRPAAVAHWRGAARRANDAGGAGQFPAVCPAAHPARRRAGGRLWADPDCARGAVDAKAGGLRQFI